MCSSLTNEVVSGNYDAGGFFDGISIEMYQDFFFYDVLGEQMNRSDIQYRNS